MKIREEYGNIFLLALVSLFTVAIAGGATLLKPADKTTMHLAGRTTARVEQAPSADKPIIAVADQTPVRVVGTPFIPNTNPRER